MNPVYVRLERGLKEVDLSDLLPGAKLTVERLDATQIAAAHDRAQKAVKALSDGMLALGDYGLDYSDTKGKRANLADPDQMFRIGTLIGAVEVAMEGIKVWNITLTPGAKEAAPINRQSLAVFLMDEYVQARVMGEIQAAARILAAEGKGSGASQNGSSTEETIA